MAKKKTPKEKAEVHKDLKGFDISVDSFGNIQSTMDIDEIKTFLDKNTDDKKLRQLKDSEEE